MQKRVLLENIFFVCEFDDDTEYFLRLITDEAAVNEKFNELINDSHWDWDRSSMLYELEKGAVNVIDQAAYVIGRIYQTEGDLVSVSQYLNTLLDGEIIMKDAPFAVFQNNLWLGDDEKVSEMYQICPYEIIAFGDYLYDRVGYLALIMMKYLAF